MEAVIEFLNSNSNAISAVANVFMAIGACVIPFAIFQMQKKEDKRRSQIGESNAMLLKLIDDRIAQNVRPITEEELEAILGDFEDETERLKTKAYEYICLKIIATTSEVSKYLGVSKDEAVDILNRLYRIEGRIKLIAMCDPSNDDAPWQKA